MKYKFEAGDKIFDERPKCSYCSSEAEFASPDMEVANVCFKPDCHSQYVQARFVLIQKRKEEEEPN